MFSKDSDVKGFQYFMERSLPRISGLHDQEFWSEFIVGVAMTDQGLRQALSALGSLTRGWNLQHLAVSETEIQSLKAQSLEDYNRAIRFLTTHQQKSKLALIASCVIFIALDMIVNGNMHGMRHWLAGVAILQEWYADRPNDIQSSPEDEVIARLVLPFFQRLNLHFGGDQMIANLPETKTRATLQQMLASGWAQNNSQSLRSLVLGLPAKFPDVESSGRYLQRMAQRMSLQIPEPNCDGNFSSEDVKQQLEQAKELLSVWRSAFTRMRTSATHGQKDEKSLISATHQEAYSHFLHILLNTYQRQDEMVFDSFEADFRAITFLCRKHLMLENALVGRPATEPVFRVNPCLLPMLWYVGNQCRDPYIRREAVEFLEGYYQVESGIPSTNTALQVRGTIEIEEHNTIIPQTSGDIPVTNRVRSIGISYDPKGFDLKKPYQRPQIRLRWLCYPYKPDSKVVSQTMELNMSEGGHGVNTSIYDTPPAQVVMPDGLKPPDGVEIPAPTAPVVLMPTFASWVYDFKNFANFNLDLGTCTITSIGE